MFESLGLTRHGTREILLAAAGTAALILILSLLGLWWLAILPLLVFGWVICFFRNPVRVAPENPQAVLSPADGTVTHILERDEPDFIGGRALMIGIFLSIFDVHLNRAPTRGTVRHIRYTPGKFHDARDELSSGENESNAIGFETPHASAPKIMVKQIAGRIARRIVCACSEGDPVAPGQELGMIKFGSRTEIYLPADCKLDIRVAVGDKVRAGTTILGELP